MDTLKRTKSSLSQSKPSRKKQRLDEDVSNTEDPRTHPKFSAQDFTRQSKVVDAGNDEIGTVTLERYIYMLILQFSSS